MNLTNPELNTELFIVGAVPVYSTYLTKVKLPCVKLLFVPFASEA